MISKFSLYDFIVAIIPGVLFLWGISLLKVPIDLPITGSIAETSILIVLAYVIGLLLQGISKTITEKLLIKSWGGFPSAIWLLQEDNNFSSEYKDSLRKIVNRKFSISQGIDIERTEQIKKNQEIFQLCYNFIESEKLGEKPLVYNAHYGLFRSLFTVFIFLFVIYILFIIFSSTPDKAHYIFLAAIYALCAIISFFRAKKRGEDFVKSVYDLFVVTNGNAGV